MNVVHGLTQMCKILKQAVASVDFIHETKPSVALAIVSSYVDGLEWSHGMFINKIQSPHAHKQSSILIRQLRIGILGSIITPGAEVGKVKRGKLTNPTNLGAE